MHEVRRWDGKTATIFPDPCGHSDWVPVESIVTGEVLARLCLGCDLQMPPDPRAIILQPVRHDTVWC